jgi:hypothetical protein
MKSRRKVSKRSIVAAKREKASRDDQRSSPRSVKKIMMKCSSIKQSNNKKPSSRGWFKHVINFHSSFSPNVVKDEDPISNTKYSKDYEILIIDMRDHDESVLTRILELADAQKQYFREGYLDSIQMMPYLPNVVLFCAVNRDNNEINELLGFAMVEIKDNDFHLDTIATRSFMNKSYKGIGTNLVESIVDYFTKEKSKSRSILTVHARPEALPFYLKVGFKKTKTSRDLYIQL